MLADFIKIFKTDKVSEALVNCIKREAEKLKAKQAALQAQQTPRAQEQLANAFMRKIKEKSDDGLDQKEESKVKSGYSILMKAVNEAAAVD